MKKNRMLGAVLCAACLAVAHTPNGVLPQVQLAAAATPADAEPQNFVAAVPPALLADPGFQDAAGKTVHLADFKGRPLLVNFWATWCAPCIHELPGLVKRQKTMPGLQVVFVSLDRGGPEAVAKFQAGQSLGGFISHYDDKSKFSRSLGIASLPVTLLIDAQGRERGRINGPADWGGTAATALIRRTLMGKPDQ